MKLSTMLILFFAALDASAAPAGPVTEAKGSSSLTTTYANSQSRSPAGITRRRRVIASDELTSVSQTRSPARFKPARTVHPLLRPEAVLLLLRPEAVLLPRPEEVLHLRPEVVQRGHHGHLLARLLPGRLLLRPEEAPPVHHRHTKEAPLGHPLYL
ncbi:hypothetical protein QBC39DRAFT_377004 [Podospora conica]|nr:hypothetical protein QBC39DRAFT_377004 [Schizothecium conicum]